ncbi:hypothetical protein CBP36_20045 (plasmid) [Acidovorax carolinensis]|uniref:Prepilin-type cleavage/methylation domain-containing protein n=1 Tax=Acidovorax carolinensis TaxID=553814 RepID=A0A240UID8_9BURK|nr:prepilin-type N-terminal cleavage/methylation domain-containing protein [Acidovorax carolinensis]ART57205.1 hypothetical protein CBP35_20025 [Acidovorax carolinensis]ART61261.1 hypothetical protein CBP36_20045 [Acidovorax carolinensis]
MTTQKSLIRKNPIWRRVSGGFTIIELMVVLAITAIASIYAAQKMMDEINLRTARLAGDGIKSVGKAVEMYIAGNSGTFPAAPFDITVANLQTLNLLPTSFPGTTPWGSGYTIRIRPLPGPPPIKYEALVVTTDPWIHKGVPRIPLLGAAVESIGMAGGLTYDATGAVGLKGSWAQPDTSVANYPAANAPGKLAYYISSSVNPNDSLYLRLDGTGVMAGNLQMGNKDITGANVINSIDLKTATVEATGDVKSASVNTGTVVATANVSGATLTSLGDINVGSGGTIRSPGRLHIQAEENLYLQPFANPAGSPTIVGGGGGSGSLNATNVVAANDVAITSLSSRPNAPTTTSVKTLLPKLVEIASYIVTANGQPVPVPTCPGGTPSVFILPHVTAGIAVGGVWGATIRMNGPSGGNWFVDARDAAGAAIPSARVPAGNFSAIVRSFCSY